MTRSRSDSHPGSVSKEYFYVVSGNVKKQTCFKQLVVLNGLLALLLVYTFRLKLCGCKRIITLFDSCLWFDYDQRPVVFLMFFDHKFYS